METLLNCSTINCSNTTTTNKTEPEVYNKLSSPGIFLTIYILFFLFAVIGNGLVCWIVLTNRRMHDSTNILLVNLALSDLLLALATTFQVADLAVKDLNLGKYFDNSFILQFTKYEFHGVSNIDFLMFVIVYSNESNHD